MDGDVLLGFQLIQDFIGVALSKPLHGNELLIQPI